MKLNPPASSSDLEAARVIARRLHQQRRTEDRSVSFETPAPLPPRHTAPPLRHGAPPPLARLAPIADDEPPSPPEPRPFAAALPEPAIAIDAGVAPAYDTGALFEPSFPGDVGAVAAPAPAPAATALDFPPPPATEEPEPPGWDAVAPADAAPSPGDALDALTEPEPTARFNPLHAHEPAPGDVEDVVPIDVVTPTDAPDLSQMPSPFDEGEPATAEELFDEPAPPSWDEVVESCRRLAYATGAMLVDPAGQVFAARGDWPDPGAEAIAAKLVATMARTLKDAPTRSISAPLGGLQLTAWRVPLAEGLVTAAFIADTPLRPDVRPAIDTEIHRGPGA